LVFENFCLVSESAHSFSDQWRSEEREFGGAEQNVKSFIQKFPDWPPGARTANVQLSATRYSCIYFVSQSSEMCRYNPLSCVSMSVYCCERVFRYRLSPETFGYALVFLLVC